MRVEPRQNGMDGYHAAKADVKRGKPSIIVISKVKTPIAAMRVKEKP